MMAVSAEFLVSLNRKTECKICLGRLKNPRSLPCLPLNHSYCKRCLDGLLKFKQNGSATVACPNRCENGTVAIGENETTEKLPKNYELMDILGLMEGTSKPPELSICQEESCVSTVQLLCVGCKSKYCKVCYDKKHQCDRKQCLSIVYDGNSEDFVVVCDEHQSAAVIVCRTCNDEMMCTYCFHRSHNQNHLYENIHQSAVRFRNTLKSDLNKGAEYYSKTNFTYKDQLRSIQQLRTKLEMKSKDNVIRELQKDLKDLVEKHEDTMHDFDATFLRHHEFLDKNDYLNEDMMEVTNRFEKEVNEMRDIDILTDRNTILENTERLSTIRCFSLQQNNPDGLVAQKREFDISLSNTSIDAGEVIQPVNCNLKNTEGCREELEKILHGCQAYINKLSPSSTLNIVENKSQDSQAMEINEIDERCEKFINDVILPAIEKKLIDLLKLIVKERRTVIYSCASRLLHKAVECGFIEGVQLILDVNKTVINCMNNDKTVLHKACKKGYNDIISLLLDNNASMDKNFSETSSVEKNIDMKNDKGWTALIVAAKNGHIDTVDLLLNRDANVDVKYVNGSTALLFAAQHGHTDTVRLLLDRNADINTKNNEDLTALIFAAQSGNADIVRLLLDRNVDINTKNDDDFTALMYGHTDTVKLLLDRNADINSKCYDGSTALMYAAENGHTDTVRLLLDRKADINSENDGGSTALIIAVIGHCKYQSRCHMDTVRLLLDKNADKEMAGLDKMTALMYAAHVGNDDTVSLLLDRHANIEMKDCGGWTALIWAARNGQRDTVCLLLNRKAEIDIRNNDGSTALIQAARGNHTSTVKLLLDKGALRNIMNNDGKTALLYAKERGFTQITALFKNNN